MSEALQSLPPFELLRKIEARSQARALGLPQQIEVRRTWSGIGFRSGPDRLVTPMGEVAEILEYPGMTRVPSALPWVKGIANIRGSLLPVMDLQGFVSGNTTVPGRRSRVLVMRSNNLECGLLVDEVLGLRHFFEEEKQPGLDGVTDEFMPYVEGSYRQGDSVWGIFSPRKLAETPAFMEVASRS